MAGIVILDASALIALYKQGDVHHEWAREIFFQTAEDKFVMSTLSFTEALVHPQSTGTTEQFLANTRGLEVRFVPISEADCVPLASIRAETRLKMPDAVVLYTAIKESAIIATTDSGLAKTAAKFGVEVLSPLAD